MALPKKPLELTMDVKQLTVGQLRLLTEPVYNPLELNRFIVAHSAWTQDELDAVLVNELDELRERVSNHVADKMRPLSDESGSAPGPESKKTKKAKT